MTRTLPAIGLALALLLVACGSDDELRHRLGRGDGEAAESSTTTAATTEEPTSTTTEEPTSSTEEESTTSTAEPPAAAVEPIQQRDLSIVSIDFETAMIEVVNNTDADIDLDGHVLCNFPSYAPLEGVGVIGPGETMTIMSTVAIPADDGELGIYATGDFANPDDIVAYVEWGGSNHTRSEVAVAAGIWDGVALTPDGTVLTP